jgi:Got1/Sft2-like family
MQRVSHLCNHLVCWATSCEVCVQLAANEFANLHACVRTRQARLRHHNSKSCCRAGFVFFFTAGNIAAVSATCFLVGPAKQLRNMFTRDRMAAAAAFLGAMILTLVVTLKVLF